jgi:hypothetical protein
MKRKTFVLTAIGVLTVSVGTAVPTFAAGNANSGFTTGDCISDIFYGNEPNTADGSPGGPAEQEPGTKGGNILPSQSPGPKVTNPATGEVTTGNSIGYYQQRGVNIPKLCHAASELD